MTEETTVDETAERWFTVPNRADRRRLMREHRARSRRQTRWYDRNHRPSGLKEIGN